MNLLTKIGRGLYGCGIIAIGIHHLILKDFRAEFIPPAPAWAHQYIFFPLLLGLTLIFSGLVISGLLNIKSISARNVSLYLAFGLLVLTVVFQLPYVFFLSPHPASRLDVWFGVGETVAFAGGALVMAGSFSEESTPGKNVVVSLTEKLIPFGGVFYSILMILFGFSHFVFTAFVSTMVPKFVGAPYFWTYFFGVALIGSGLAIVFKIFVRPIATLQAIMLFLFFIFFHIPDAIANPTAGGGNEIVRAIVALLFIGISLVIATTATSSSMITRK